MRIIRTVSARAACGLARMRATVGRRCADERGQGTTEYAILVGVSTSRNSLNGENIV